MPGATGVPWNILSPATGDGGSGKRLFLFGRRPTMH